MRDSIVGMNSDIHDIYSVLSFLKKLKKKKKKKKKREREKEKPTLLEKWYELAFIFHPIPIMRTHEKLQGSFLKMRYERRRRGRVIKGRRLY